MQYMNLELRSQLTDLLSVPFSEITHPGIFLYPLCSPVDIGLSKINNGKHETYVIHPAGYYWFIESIPVPPNFRINYALQKRCLSLAWSKAKIELTGDQATSKTSKLIGLSRTHFTVLFSTYSGPTAALPSRSLNDLAARSISNRASWVETLSATAGVECPHVREMYWMPDLYPFLLFAPVHSVLLSHWIFSTFGLIQAFAKCLLASTNVFDGKRGAADKFKSAATFKRIFFCSSRLVLMDDDWP